MKKLLFSLTFLLLLCGTYAHAQTPLPQQTAPTFCTNGTCTYTPLEPLPLPGGGAVNSTTFPGYVASAFKLLLSAAATIAMVMLVIGALTYMFSDVVGNKSKALGRIRNSMWAIIILVSSFLVLKTINPDLVTFKLNLGAINNNANANIQALSAALTGTNVSSAQAAPTNSDISQCQAKSSGNNIYTMNPSPDGGVTCTSGSL